VTKENRAKTSHLFNVISAILAFILWGGWAYYVNETKAHSSGMASGVAQGVASFTITIFMVHVITWLYHLFHRPRLKLFLPAKNTLIIEI